MPIPNTIEDTFIPIFRPRERLKYFPVVHQTLMCCRSIRHRFTFQDSHTANASQRFVHQLHAVKCRLTVSRKAPIIALNLSAVMVVFPPLVFEAITAVILGRKSSLIFGEQPFLSFCTRRHVFTCSIVLANLTR